jgi:hypothetical protein
LVRLGANVGCSGAIYLSGRGDWRGCRPALRPLPNYSQTVQSTVGNWIV